MRKQRKKGFCLMLQYSLLYVDYYLMSDLASRPVHFSDDHEFCIL
jgi:hypothetical protein